MGNHSKTLCKRILTVFLPVGSVQWQKKVDDKMQMENTFVVRVTSSENGSWQGEVIWANERKIEEFHSTLELIKLIDSALSIEEFQAERFFP